MCILDCTIRQYLTLFHLGYLINLSSLSLRKDLVPIIYSVNRCPYWWGGVVNLFWHLTAFNQSDYSIDQSNCRTALTCQNKFTTPPHQYRRLWSNHRIKIAQIIWDFQALLKSSVQIIFLILLPIIICYKTNKRTKLYHDQIKTCGILAVQIRQKSPKIILTLTTRFKSKLSM